jgi:hypothetical protein
MDSQHSLLQQQRYDGWVVSFIAFNMLNARRGGGFFVWRKLLVQFILNQKQRNLF